MVVVAAGGTAAGSYRNKMAGPRCRVDARSSRDARTSIPRGAKPTAGGVVQGYATQPPQAAQAVGTVVPASPAVAPPPYGAVTPPPQAVAEVVAVAPMDRK